MKKLEDLTEREREQFEYYVRAEGIIFKVNTGEPKVNTLVYDDDCIKLKREDGTIKNYYVTPKKNSNMTGEERLNTALPNEIVVFEANRGLNKSRINDNILPITAYSGALSKDGFSPLKASEYFLSNTMGSSYDPVPTVKSHYLPAIEQVDKGGVTISYIDTSSNTTGIRSTLDYFVNRWGNVERSYICPGAPRKASWYCQLYTNDKTSCYRNRTTFHGNNNSWVLKTSSTLVPMAYTKKPPGSSSTQVYRIYIVGRAFSSLAPYTLYNEVINFNEQNIIMSEKSLSKLLVDTYLVGENIRDIQDKFISMLKARLTLTFNNYDRLFKNRVDFMITIRKGEHPSSVFNNNNFKAEDFKVAIMGEFNRTCNGFKAYTDDFKLRLEREILEILSPIESFLKTPE